MTTTTERFTSFAGLIPAKVTLPARANELIHKGCLVCRDADGRAQEAAYDEGLNVAGVAVAAFDNRTTAPEGGGAGAINVELDCGVFAFAYNGTAPLPGQVVFVYQNDTVSTDSHSSACGIVGYCVETDTTAGLCYVWLGPHVVGQIVIAAAVAADLVTAQAAIDALEASELTAQARINIPLTDWCPAGGPIAAFADGTVDGLALVDSEAQGIRWNDGVFTVFSASVPLPEDLDDTADVVFHALAFRVGAADTTVVLTLGAFSQTVGAAHTASADAGGNTGALGADTTIVAELTRTIAAASVPAAPCNLTLTLRPSAALDADDLVVTATWLEYTKKLLTA